MDFKVVGNPTYEHGELSSVYDVTVLIESKREKDKLGCFCCKLYGNVFPHVLDPRCHSISGETDHLKIFFLAGARIDTESLMQSLINSPSENGLECWAILREIT